MLRNEMLFIVIQDLVGLQFIYSLGTGYIRAYLASKGIGSLQFICENTGSLDSLVEQILSLDIPVIGFTCYESNYPRVAMLANALKKKKKDILIVAGGPSPTFADEIILKDTKAIDICVRGEGEYTVYELLTALKQGRSIANVKGISYRSRGRLIRTPERELINSGVRGAELDIIPSPYLSGAIPPEQGLVDSYAGMLTSRGCPNKCSFCNFSIMDRQTVRFHSAERVIEEIKLLWQAGKKIKELSKRRISIYDSNFTAYPERAKEICMKILKAGLTGIDLGMETRADRLDRELMDLLLKAGVKGINFGLESAVPRLLNRIQKVRVGQRGQEDNYKVERKYIASVRKMAKYGKSIGMEIAINMIQGLPGENYEDVRTTVNFIKSLGIEYFPQMQLQVYPGTELFVNSDKYGIKLKKARKGSLHFAIENPPPGMYYPREFPVEEKLNFLYNKANPSAFRIFCHALCPATGGPAEGIAVVNTARFPPGLLSWLNKEASIEANISFLGEKITKKDIEENFSSVLRHGFIKRFIHYLIENGSPAKSGIRTLSSMTLNFDSLLAVPSSPWPKFHLIPLASYQRADKLILPNKGRYNYIIFTIETQSDIETLTQIAGSLDRRGRFILPKSLNRFVPSLEDECRWLDLPCPALCLSKVIVDSKGRIYPCLKGKSVGKLNESLGEIRSRAKSLMEKEIAIRGCAHCEVEAQCSKCLFPYPMDRKEYCHIRRSNPNIHRVASMMKIPRSILWTSAYEFRPQRLVFISKKGPQGKKEGSLGYNKTSLPSKLLSLGGKILEEVSSYRDDILLFQWGGEYLIGFRKHRYFDYFQEPVTIYNKRYRLHKQGKKQLERFFKFIRDAIVEIPKDGSAS